MTFLSNIILLHLSSDSCNAFVSEDRISSTAHISTIPTPKKSAAFPSNSSSIPQSPAMVSPEGHGLEGNSHLDHPSMLVDTSLPSAVARDFATVSPEEVPALFESHLHQPSANNMHPSSIDSLTVSSDFIPPSGVDSMLQSSVVPEPGRVSPVEPPGPDETQFDQSAMHLSTINNTLPLSINRETSAVSTHDDTILGCKDHLHRPVKVVDNIPSSSVVPEPGRVLPAEPPGPDETQFDQSAMHHTAIDNTLPCSIPRDTIPVSTHDGTVLGCEEHLHQSVKVVDNILPSPPGQDPGMFSMDEVPRSEESYPEKDAIFESVSDHSIPSPTTQQPTMMISPLLSESSTLQSAINTSHSSLIAQPDEPCSSPTSRLFLRSLSPDGSRTDTPDRDVDMDVDVELRGPNSEGQPANTMELHSDGVQGKIPYDNNGGTNGTLECNTPQSTHMDDSNLSGDIGTPTCMDVMDTNHDSVGQPPSDQVTPSNTDSTPVSHLRKRRRVVYSSDVSDEESDSFDSLYASVWDPFPFQEFVRLFHLCFQVSFLWQMAPSDKQFISNTVQRFKCDVELRAFDASGVEHRFTPEFHVRYIYAL